jgi:hypothetical protein
MYFAVRQVWHRHQIALLVGNNGDADRPPPFVPVDTGAHKLWSSPGFMTISLSARWRFLSAARNWSGVPASTG